MVGGEDLEIRDAVRVCVGSLGGWFGWGRVLGAEGQIGRLGGSQRDRSGSWSHPVISPSDAHPTPMAGPSPNCTPDTPPGVQALLRKLQSLVEVPGRLRRWAAPGADPARALHCYARARAVLRHYRHLPSFRAIEDESHSIMAELAQRLRARLRYVRYGAF